MSNQDSQNYIRESRQAGKTDDQIRRELLDAGWGEVEINKIFTSTSGYFSKFFVILWKILPSIIYIISGVFLIIITLVPYPLNNWYIKAFSIVIVITFLYSGGITFLRITKSRGKIFGIIKNLFLLFFGIFILYNFLFYKFPIWPLSLSHYPGTTDYPGVVRVASLPRGEYINSLLYPSNANKNQVVSFVQEGDFIAWVAIVNQDLSDPNKITYQITAKNITENTIVFEDISQATTGGVPVVEIYSGNLMIKDFIRSLIIFVNLKTKEAHYVANLKNSWSFDATLGNGFGVWLEESKNPAAKFKDSSNPRIVEFDLWIYDFTTNREKLLIDRLYNDNNPNRPGIVALGRRVVVATFDDKLHILNIDDETIREESLNYRLPAAMSRIDEESIILLTSPKGLFYPTTFIIYNITNSIQTKIYEVDFLKNKDRGCPYQIPSYTINNKEALYWSVERQSNTFCLPMPLYFKTEILK